MRDSSFLRRAVLAASLVTETAILTIAGVLAGSWLDEALGVSPLFLLLLSIGGLVSGVVVIHRVLQRSSPSDD